MTEIKIPRSQGLMSAYHAMPARPNGRGVVVAQEIFGVNVFIRDVVAEFARWGYEALAPDLYWRTSPNVMLDPNQPADVSIARQLRHQTVVNDAVADLEAAVHSLRDSVREVAIVGYCFGGLLAYLSACAGIANAAVVYYGVGIENFVSDEKQPLCPMLLHIAGEDAHCPRSAQAAIATALADHSMVQMHCYDGAGHAFARPTSTTYDARLARMANQRTEGFLAAQFGPEATRRVVHPQA